MNLAGQLLLMMRIKLRKLVSEIVPFAGMFIMFAIIYVHERYS